MKPSIQKSRWTPSAFSAVLLVAVSCLGARAQSNTPATKSHRTKKSVKHTTSKGTKPGAHHATTKKVVHHSTGSTAKSTTKSTKAKHRYTPRSSRARLAALHMEPQRAEEIQGALIREGYLQGPATGKWDEATKDAMRRYQKESGFNSTGQPDAKSLMKLGLGPHPLPDSVKSSAANQAAIDALSKPNPN